MIKQPNMRLIGLFVSISLIAIFLLFGYFLKSKFDDEDTTVVMYFDESVKGLETGAPVLFKGVKVGEVTEVRLMVNLKKMQFFIPVYAKIYSGRSLVTDTHDRKERLEQFIKQGLRAQLAMSSVITGQLLIELDMFPDTPAVLRYSDDKVSDYQIPTILSPFAEISKTLQVMPVTKIAQDVHNITQTIEEELPPMMKRINSTLDTLDSILKENKSDTRILIEHAGNAAQAIDQLVGENAENVAAMLEGFSAAAASMKNLTDYLQMYPSALITGKEY